MKLSTVESIVDGIAEKPIEVIGVYKHGIGGIKVCLGHYDDPKGNLRVASYSFGFQIVVETIHPNPDFANMKSFSDRSLFPYFKHTHKIWGCGPFSAIHKKIKAIKKKADEHDATIEQQKLISAVHTLVDLTGVEFDKQVLEDK